MEFFQIYKIGDDLELIGHRRKRRGDFIRHALGRLRMGKIIDWLMFNSSLCNLLMQYTHNPGKLEESRGKYITDYLNL